MATIVRIFGALAALGVLGCQEPQVSLLDTSARAQPLYEDVNFCIKCHGGLDNDTGAPPRDVAGFVETTRPSVGAHTAHVEAGAIARALACRECHPDTADVCSTLHLDRVLQLQFGATASAHGVTPTYGAQGCTNWCHGEGLAGGSNPRPVWTSVGTGQASCGSCHGIPPIMPSPRHPSVPYTRCMTCHPETMTIDYMARDILIPGGPKHVNGVIEAQGHDEGWVDLASPYGGTHGKNLMNGAGPLGHAEYLGECTQCHGSAGVLTIDGGWTGVGCGDCHAAFFITQQPVGNKCGGFTNVPCVSCVFCH